MFHRMPGQQSHSLVFVNGGERELLGGLEGVGSFDPYIWLYPHAFPNRLGLGVVGPA